MKNRGDNPETKLLKAYIGFAKRKQQKSASFNFYATETETHIFSVTKYSGYAIQGDIDVHVNITLIKSDVF